MLLVIVKIEVVIEACRLLLGRGPAAQGRKVLQQGERLITRLLVLSRFLGLLFVFRLGVFLRIPLVVALGGRIGRMHHVVLLVAGSRRFRRVLAACGGTRPALIAVAGLVLVLASGVHSAAGQWTAKFDCLDQKQQKRLRLVFLHADLPLDLASALVRVRGQTHFGHKYVK